MEAHDKVVVDGGGRRLLVGTASGETMEKDTILLVDLVFNGI